MGVAVYVKENNVNHFVEYEVMGFIGCVACKNYIAKQKSTKFLLFCIDHMIIKKIFITDLYSYIQKCLKIKNHIIQ